MKRTRRQNLLAAALVAAPALPALAQTSSSFYRPLTLAPADDPAGGGGGEPAKEDEDKGGLSAEELAKIAQNPVANMIPFQNNFNFDVGPNKVTQYVMRPTEPTIPSGYVACAGRWRHRADRQAGRQAPDQPETRGL
jgi:hypothetical protein